MRQLILLGAIFITACNHTDALLDAAPNTPEAAIQECLLENQEATREQCDIKYCFSNKIILEGMNRILMDVDDTLKKLKIRYWLEGGSLYGARRFNAFLPWDDDVDINVIGDEFDKYTNEFRKIITSKGYRMLEWGGPFSKRTPDFWQIIFNEHKWREHILEVAPEMSLDDVERMAYEYQLHDNLPHLDIFLFDYINSLTLQYRSSFWQKVSPQGFNYSILLADAGKTQPTLKILDRTYPIPNKVNEYLKIYINSDDASDTILESPHSDRCSAKLRFKNLKNDKEILKYIRDYLKHVFGDRFIGFANDFEP